MATDKEEVVLADNGGTDDEFAGLQSQFDTGFGFNAHVPEPNTAPEPSVEYSGKTSKEQEQSQEVMRNEPDNAPEPLAAEEGTPVASSVAEPSVGPSEPVAEPNADQKASKKSKKKEKPAESEKSMISKSQQAIQTMLRRRGKANSQNLLRFSRTRLANWCQSAISLFSRAIQKTKFLLNLPWSVRFGIE